VKSCRELCWATDGSNKCHEPSTAFYQYSSREASVNSFGGFDVVHKIMVVSRCDRHRVKLAKGWKEITYEDAVVVWIHQS
jgi:hypothetical protein